MNRALWKCQRVENSGKRTACFPPFSTPPWKSRKGAEIPTFPQRRRLLDYVPDGAEEEELVCGGKVEIQKQDSHFPTAPMACGARKEYDWYELETLVR
jgi:hypothetical protein